MSPKLFLLLNLAFGFYNVGTIWAHEVDIFRTWKLLDQKSFHDVQEKHWHKLPYWVFIPVGLTHLLHFGRLQEGLPLEFAGNLKVFCWQDRFL